MGDAPFIDAARVQTKLRDFDALRRAIRSHDPEATEAAWEKCERWVDTLRCDTQASLRAEVARLSAEVERLSAKQGDGGLPTCRRCDADMTRGLMLVQTYRAGEPDFPGDKTASTFSAGGPGRITGCWKCPKCGHSIVDAIRTE